MRPLQLLLLSASARKEENGNVGKAEENRKMHELVKDGNLQPRHCS